MAHDGPASQRPNSLRPNPDFPQFFVQQLQLHTYALICIDFGCAIWTRVSLNSFTIKLFESFDNALPLYRVLSTDD